MNTVKVDKGELLKRITENRDKHRAIFEDALIGYRKCVIEELDKRLADARSGRKIDLYIGLIEPQDHTKDYNSAIDMLEMSVDSEITLTSVDFRRYVRDEWEWKEQFIGSTAVYNTSAFRSEE